MRAFLALGVVLLAGALVPQSPAKEAASLQFDQIVRMPPTLESLQQPLAVHADRYTGELFVADIRRNMVAVFDSQGWFRYVIPGGSVFRSPVDVATWPDGRILLLAHLEQGRGLVKLDFDGRDPQILSLTGIPEQAATPKLTSMALSADGDRLYLLDEANHGVWISDSQGRIEKMIDLAPNYDQAAREEQTLPRVDVYGERVLVTLPVEGEVRLFNLDGRGLGSVGLKGGSTCETAFPVAAALDEQGRVYVADQQRALISVWQVESNRCLGEVSGIGRRPGRLYRPADITLDHLGQISVGQGFDGRVQQFDGARPAAGSAHARGLKR